MPDQLSRFTQSIRRYYEQNTRLFLSFGGSAGSYAIHRAVWAEGVATLEEALHYTNHLILAEAENLPASACLRLADLGCGIGGTLFYLLTHLNKPVQSVGLTISPLQARLARERACQLSLDEISLFVEADFLSPPLAGGFDMVYSVEAFVHAAAPELYFEQAARLLKPGGRLVLVDDFRIDNGAPVHAQPSLERSRRRWLQAYQDGWHAPNLCTPGQAIELAQSHALIPVMQLDLTPHLRLRALPDGLASFLLAFGERLSWRHAILPSMLGSMALQQCLKMGWIGYHFMAFEKRA